MSRRDSQVEQFNYDKKFSCGDSNDMALQSKPNYKKDGPKSDYIEENNNDINDLSKNFSDMGCIVDGVKRPPNICVETCVFNDSSTESSDNEKEGDENEEVNYSDEFEEDGSEVEDHRSEPNHTEVPDTQNGVLSPPVSSVQFSKSQSFMSNKPPASVSGKSSNFGSVTSGRNRRVNMSFTNERVREIERHNHILLNKILSARNTRKSSIPQPQREEPRRMPPSAAVLRKKQQQKIDHENMMLLKRLQRAKSSYPLPR